MACSSIRKCAIRRVGWKSCVVSWWVCARPGGLDARIDHQRRPGAHPLKVGQEPVLSAVSGGVDSSVATALVHRAVGQQLVAVFVDTGLLRLGEVAQVQAALHESLGVEMVVVDAVDRFMRGLHGVVDPEQKRRIIGEIFIRTFEEQARRLGQPRFLVQGTIYPDVVESSAPDRAKAHRIKTHHNVGGLPEDMDFTLVEPLRYLFKDEVRVVGEALGLPPALVWRQPFPGPGLAVRCLGEVTPERLERLRGADAILLDELSRAGLLHPTLRHRSGAGDCAGVCRFAAGALGRGDGRSAHLPGSGGLAGSHDRRFHDSRLGAPASRPAGDDCQPYRK